MVAALWKVFVKARQPGWAAIIPFYNQYVILQMVGKPGWWLLLFFIPVVNLIVAIIVNLALAESFGKSAGFGIGLTFLSIVFIPILGFGPAQYRGPVSVPAATPPAQQ